MISFPVSPPFSPRYQRVVSSVGSFVLGFVAFASLQLVFVTLLPLFLAGPPTSVFLLLPSGRAPPPLSVFDSVLQAARKGGPCLCSCYPLGTAPSLTFSDLVTRYRLMHRGTCLGWAFQHRCPPRSVNPPAMCPRLSSAVLSRLSGPPALLSAICQLLPSICSVYPTPRHPHHSDYCILIPRLTIIPDSSPLHPLITSSADVPTIASSSHLPTRSFASGIFNLLPLLHSF